MSKYTNAKKVLPPELYNELIKHFSGGTLYVPDDDAREAVARKLVFELKKGKMSSREMPECWGLPNGESIKFLLRECESMRKLSRKFDKNKKNGL